MGHIRGTVGYDTGLEIKCQCNINCTDIDKNGASLEGGGAQVLLWLMDNNVSRGSQRTLAR